MDTKSKYEKFAQQLFQCVNENEFQELFVAVLNLDDNELIRFLLKTGCYRLGKEKVFGKTLETKRPDFFWKSPVPIVKARLLFKSRSAGEFLYGYFGFDLNADTRITETVCGANPVLFIKNCKLSQAILKRPFYESLVVLKRSNIPQLSIFYKEVTFLFETNYAWKKDREKYGEKLARFSIDEILINFTSYHEKFKRASKKVTNNRSELVSNEVHLCHTLSEMLKDLKKSAKDSKLTSSLETLQFENLLEQTLPPINSPEGLAHKVYIPKEEITDTKAAIRMCIEFYFAEKLFKNNLDKYCTGMADFETLNEEEATLRTNRKYILYARNDTKNKYIENYYGNAASLKNSSKEKIADIQTWEREQVLNTFRQQYETLGITTNNSKLTQQNLINSVELLSNFSKWIMPQGRTIINNPVEETKEGTIMEPMIFRKEVPQEFLLRFKPAYMVRIGQKELIKKLADYFRWDTREVSNIVDFLTYDLNKTYSYPVEFICQPFLKAEDNYYWMSSLLRDRHWANLIHTRLVKDKLLDSKTQAAQVESRIASWFNEAGFAAIASFKYGNENGEIDTLAYKDGHLLFVEYKTTYVSENLIREHQYDNDILEIKSAGQLTRAIEFYKNNFDFFQKREDLKINRQFDNIKVHGLIVSNNFEADGTYKNEAFLKISLLELEVILKNRLYYLYNTPIPGFLLNKGVDEYLPLDALQLIINRNNLRLKDSHKMPSDKEVYNLWKGPSLTFERFYEILKNDEVWYYMDKNWQSNIIEEYHISKYNPEKRLLD